MTVLSVTEDPDGWTGSGEVKGGNTYQRVFIITVDDINDGPATARVASGVPSLGALYSPGESDLSAFVKSKSARRRSGSRLVWEVTVSYGTESNDQEDPQDNDNDGNDPTLDRPVVTVQTAQFSRIATSATFLGVETESSTGANVPFRLSIGDNGPLQNSAGIEYDPPIDIDDSRLMVRIEKNVSQFSGTILAAYPDAINSDSININAPGWFVWAFPHFAKMMGIWAKPMYARGVQYTKLTYEIAIDPRGFDVSLLDRGAVELTGSTGTAISSPSEVAGAIRKNVVDNSGNQVPQLVNLNGNGMQLSADGEVRYMKYQVYNEQPFAALGYPIT